MNIARFIFIILAVTIACKTNDDSNQYTAFTGANIIDGSGGPPVQNGILLIQNGHIVALGTAEYVTIPDNAIVKKITGKTIVPGFINAHGHVGDTKGIEGGHYSRENVIDNLSLYARYGITTVVSLGGDKNEGATLRAVNDTTSLRYARLFIAGEVINGKTSEEAISVLESNQRMGIDIVKIRVDDNLGTATKMPETVYRAVINRSHEMGYKVAAHLYYLEDAKKLLDAGIDMLAHSVRDLPVDDTFIQLIQTKKACYCPTLTRELSTFVYADTADFFSDPFFRAQYDSITIQPLKDPARQAQVRNNKSAATYRQQLPVAMTNLKKLCDSGVPILFGTDSGVPTRFIGYFEHLEMVMMAEAGLTPMQIIVSATKNPAACLGLKNVGTLSRGNQADFIILEDDPLADIRNMRKIADVYIGGVPVNP